MWWAPRKIIIGGGGTFLIKKLSWRAGVTKVIFLRLLLLDRSYLRVERDLGLLLRQFHPTPPDFGLALSGHRNNDVYPPWIQPSHCLRGRAVRFWWNDGGEAFRVDVAWVWSPLPPPGHLIVYLCAAGLCGGGGRICNDDVWSKISSFYCDFREIKTKLPSWAIARKYEKNHPHILEGKTQ